MVPNNINDIKYWKLTVIWEKKKHTNQMTMVAFVNRNSISMSKSDKHVERPNWCQIFNTGGIWIQADKLRNTWIKYQFHTMECFAYRERNDLVLRLFRCRIFVYVFCFSFFSFIFVVGVYGLQFETFRIQNSCDSFVSNRCAYSLNEFKYVQCLHSRFLVFGVQNSNANEILEVYSNFDHILTNGQLAKTLDMVWECLKL